MSTEKDNTTNNSFWNWGTGLTLVIILFIGATLGVVFFASSLDYYMVSENHYEKAVKYQQQIDRIEHTRALKKAVVIRQKASRDIQIQFPDSLASLRPKGTIKLYRPSDSNLDRSFELLLDDNGLQTISAANLEKGKWTVQLTWNTDNKEYFEEKEIFL